MSIEAFIGISYCIIGIIHLFILIVKRLKSHTLGEVEEIMMVTFAWPLVDILWLLNVSSLKNKS